MAAFSRSKQPARNKILTLRVSDEEQETLKGAAEKRGVDISELLREAIDEYLARHKSLTK